MEEYLEITYNDDEGDNIGLYSEEDFKAFKKLLKEKIIKNELIGKIISDLKRPNINKSFNTELDNLQQFLMGKSTNKNDYEKNFHVFGSRRSPDLHCKHRFRSG